jgi:UDP-glucose 4-epimerase
MGSVTSMRGRRVLISGMGGELGSLVASCLESEPWADTVVGIDLEPPRRRLRRAEFHLVEPGEGERVRELVAATDPHVVVHLGVYEPDARATQAESDVWTRAITAATLDPTAFGPSLQAIVVRSGLAVYGRSRRGGRPPAPTSPFGHQLVTAEEAALLAGDSARVPVALLRLGQVLGGHVPSPLGRLLRLPAVPCDAFADPALHVVDGRDAAAAIVAAARLRHAGAVEVVAPGTVTVRDALRAGHRIPLPIVGPQWFAARQLGALFGAPLPRQVEELLRHGTQVGHAPTSAEALATQLAGSAAEVVADVYAWQAVRRSVPSAHDDPTASHLRARSAA